MIKNYDFDRSILFVNLIWLKSVDFTGVYEILRLDFMWFVIGYFVVKYGIFGWVRWNALFSRVWGYFRVG